MSPRYPQNPVSSAAVPLNGSASASHISSESVIRAYQRYAPLYDRIFGAVLEPGRRKLAQVVEGLAPASILEVGVGTGLTLSRYPAKSRICGIDISPHMLAVATARARQIGRDDISLHVMDAEAMAFADGSFDCVTLPYVLSVTPDPARLVFEIRRVCRKGGTVVVLNHFSGSRFWWGLERAARPLAGRIGFRSDFGFDAQIRQHDWQVVAVEDVNLMGLSKLVTLRNT